MTDTSLIKIMAPIVFRAADKLFKFVSWAIIISIIGYAKRVTGSETLSWLFIIASIAFGVALILQAYYLMVRDPSDWGISGRFHRVSRIVQVVFGLALLSVCLSPYTIIDKIIEDLTSAKPHETIATPH
jgi:hypothetical protein